MDTVTITKKGGVQIVYQGDFEFTGNYIVLHSFKDANTQTRMVLDLTWIENIEVYTPLAGIEQEVVSDFKITNV